MLQKSAFTKEFEQNYIYQLKVAHLNSSGSTSNVHNTYICSTTCKTPNDAHKMDRIMVGDCWNKYKVNKWEGRKEARMNVHYYRCYQCAIIVLQAQNETLECARSLQTSRKNYANTATMSCFEMIIYDTQMNYSSTILL